MLKVAVIGAFVPIRRKINNLLVAGRLTSSGMEDADAILLCVSSAFSLSESMKDVDSGSGAPIVLMIDDPDPAHRIHGAVYLNDTPEEVLKVVSAAVHKSRGSLAPAVLRESPENGNTLFEA